MPFGAGRYRRWIPWASIAIPALGWIVFGLYPSIATVYYSFTRYSGDPGTSPKFIGLTNYVDAFTQLFPYMQHTIAITLYYTAGVTILQNLAGLGFALVLYKTRRGYSFWRALVFLPEIFSVVIVGVIFLLLLSPYGGPLEAIYKALSGGKTSAFLGSAHLALPICIFVNAWMFTGYTMLIYIAGLRNIPKDVYEASALDGSGKWSTFRHVTWPLLAPAATVNIWLTAMGAMGTYAIILVLTDGNYGTTTLGMYMYQAAFGSGAPGSTDGGLGLGSMVAMIQFLLTLVIGGGLLWILRRREVQL